MAGNKRLLARERFVLYQLGEDPGLLQQFDELRADDFRGAGNAAKFQRVVERAEGCDVPNARRRRGTAQLRGWVRELVAARPAATPKPAPPIEKAPVTEIQAESAPEPLHQAELGEPEAPPPWQPDEWEPDDTTTMPEPSPVKAPVQVTETAPEPPGIIINLRGRRSAAQNAALGRHNRAIRLGALWRHSQAKRNGASEKEFIGRLVKRLGADVRDPRKVPHSQLVEALNLTFEKCREIEIAESAAGNARGWRRTYKGKKLPYQFRLGMGCVDMSAGGFADFYKRLANEMSYDRKVRERNAAALQDQSNREEMRMHIEEYERNGTNIQAIIRARADARDEAIIKALRRGEKTFRDLAHALADDPAYAMKTAPQRRQAISDRVKILRKNDRVALRYTDGKFGPTAFVSLKKPANL
jgi:hypothetical protein